MHAILRIDLQARVPTTFITQDFIDAGRAEALLGGIVLRQIDADWHTVILQLKVAGLIFLMIGAGQEDGRKTIKGNDAIRFRIGDLWLFSHL